MNRNISINVAKKLASVIGAPVIICGNSDYRITFTFDEEWETLDLKTARFVYKRDGKLRFVDVVFSGRTTAVPVLSNIDEVYVGVYSGELHTTTPARIICKKSILCGDSTQHEVPDPDVYQQILEAFNNLETLPTVGAADAGRALMVNEDGHWVARTPDFMHDQNSGDLIRFFFGTSEEWNAWTGDKNGVLFCPTNDATLEAIDKAVTEIGAAVKDIDEAVTELAVAVTEERESVDARITNIENGKEFVGNAYKSKQAEKASAVSYKFLNGVDANALRTITEPGIYFVNLQVANQQYVAQAVLCVYSLTKNVSVWTKTLDVDSDVYVARVVYDAGSKGIFSDKTIDSVYYIPFPAAGTGI